MARRCPNLIVIASTGHDPRDGRLPDVRQKTPLLSRRAGHFCDTAQRIVLLQSRRVSLIRYTSLCTKSNRSVPVLNDRRHIGHSTLKKSAVKQWVVRLKSGLSTPGGFPNPFAMSGYCCGQYDQHINIAASAGWHPAAPASYNRLPFNRSPSIRTYHGMGENQSLVSPSLAPTTAVLLLALASATLATPGHGDA